MSPPRRRGKHQLLPYCPSHVLLDTCYGSTAIANKRSRLRQAQSYQPACDTLSLVTIKTCCRLYHDSVRFASHIDYDFVSANMAISATTVHTSLINNAHGDGDRSVVGYAEYHHTISVNHMSPQHAEKTAQSFSKKANLLTSSVAIAHGDEGKVETTAQRFHPGRRKYPSRIWRSPNWSDSQLLPSRHDSRSTNDANYNW